MTLGTILIIILILLLIGALPNWGYSRGFGYGPSGILGVVLVVILILVLMGRIRRTADKGRDQYWSPRKWKAPRGLKVAPLSPAPGHPGTQTAYRGVFLSGQ